MTALAIGIFSSPRAAAEDEWEGWYEDNGGVFYYEDGAALTACFAVIDGQCYYFRDDGTLLLEDETCLAGDGEGGAFWVRAGWDNVLIANEWYTDSTADPAETYYYGENFAAACGPTEIDGELYLFDDVTGMLLPNRKVVIADTLWESDYNGILSPIQEEEETPNGWVRDSEGNTYFYRDGNPLSGGFFTVYDEIRFFHDDGRMARNQSLYLDNRWIRFDDEGCLVEDETDENRDSNDAAPDEPSVPKEGWVTAGGERYYYRNGEPMSGGPHTIEWTAYYFDATGRLLHDCVVEDHLLDSDGSVVQGGLFSLNGQQYYVNPQTQLIEKNTEVNIDSTLYLADSEGHLQKKEIVPVSFAKPEEAEEEAELAEPADYPDYVPRNEKSRNEESLNEEWQYNSTAGYIPSNEEEIVEEEELQQGGSIRYSDDYQTDDTPAAENGTALKEYDNPASGMLLWRGGDWVEIHGSPERPIEVHIYGRKAAIMNQESILREAFVCSSEGVYGFDQYGNALPAGFVTRYGKQFYVTAPDPDAELLVLMLS